MAFRKTLTNTASGISGDYVRLSTLRIDYNARELSAQFQVFKDAATAARSDAQPALASVIKLRLSGADFESAFGRVAVAAAARRGEDVLAMIYAAARAFPVVSDFGPDALVDATTS